MNQYAVFHSIESAYSFPLPGKRFVLRVRVDKQDEIESCHVLYNAKHLFFLKRKEKKMTRKYEDDLYAYYEIILPLETPSLAYVFRFVCEGKDFFFSTDGLTENYQFAISYYNYFQCAFVNDIDIQREVSWAKDAIIYEIFVDRFHRGKGEGDKDFINLKWGAIPNPKSFAGGSLIGLREKLDYLKDLGVNALYLTPIFRSISNHKYDIKDYYEVDPGFGSNVAFEELVKEAHERGMRIILDAVFNHVSNENAIFQDVVRNGRNSPYFDWFIIYDEDISKGKYEKFATCDYMPKWNTSNPAVQSYLCDIGKHYVKEYGIDGWRLDVSDEISHDFWKRFRREIKTINPDVMLIGENWQDATPYLRGDEFDGIMNYSFTRYVNDYLAFHQLDSLAFKEKLETLRLRYSAPVTHTNWNLLDSHDTYRFFTQLRKNKERALIGAAIQMFYEGIPCVYYGDELPLEGGYDPDCRRCMDFSLARKSNPFFAKYRDLIRLRAKSGVLKFGELSLRTQDGMLVMERAYRGQVLALFVNLSEADKPLPPGKVVLSNLVNGETLKHEGFAIIANRKKTKE